MEELDYDQSTLVRDDPDYDQTKDKSMTSQKTLPILPSANSKSQIEIRTREEFATRRSGSASADFYHYKRWIWVMFPWACMCSKDSVPFSYLMSRCFESATRYMSVDEEEQLARDAMDIAFAYKKRINVLLYQEEKKQKMIASKIDEQNRSENDIGSPLTLKMAASEIKSEKNKTDIIRVLRDIRKKKEEEGLAHQDKFLTSRRNSTRAVDLGNKTLRIHPINNFNTLNDSLKLNVDQTTGRSSQEIAFPHRHASRSNIHRRGVSDRSALLKQNMGNLPSLHRDIPNKIVSKNRLDLRKQSFIKARPFARPSDISVDRSCFGLSTSREIQSYMGASMRKLQEAKCNVDFTNKVYRPA